MKLHAIFLACASLIAVAHSDSATTNYWKNLPKGPQVYAYYEGRSPCQEISKLLGIEKSADCHKVKWTMILYCDPKTKAPTTYALGGLAWRNPPKTGKWSLSKGTMENPNAEVILLDPKGTTHFLAFQKPDPNILLFLDHNRRLLIGNEHHSYTLSRLEKK